LISAQLLHVAYRDKLLGELRALSTEDMTAAPYSREHVASRAATRAIEQNHRASMLERQVWREEAHLRNENSCSVSEGVGGSTPWRRKGRAPSAREQ
jgi:hypothetical protein